MTITGIKSFAIVFIIASSSSVNPRATAELEMDKTVHFPKRLHRFFKEVKPLGPRREASTSNLGRERAAYHLCLPAGAVKPPFISGYAGAKTKTPFGPCSAREGV
jgi:hypothetical protein